MATKAEKFRLGVFLTSGISIIVLSILVIAGSKLAESRDTYYINFAEESVGGLDVGSKVKYHGIGVGRVDDIYISPKDVSSIIVTISIDGGTPLKDDVKATLSPVGITGLNAIEITGGTNESPLLAKKSYIEVEKSLLGNITTKAVSITEQLDMLIKSLNKLADQDNIEDISSIINNLDEILTENRQTLEGTMANLESISGDVAVFTSVLGTKMDTLVTSATASMNSINSIMASGSIANIVTNLDTISTDLAGANLDVLVESLNRSVIRLESMLNTVDNTVVRSRRDVLDILETARETFENLNEFSKQINDQPSVLIRSSNN